MYIRRKIGHEGAQYQYMYNDPRPFLLEFLLDTKFIYVYI